MPLIFECGQQALHIAAGGVHIGFLHIDIVQTNQRIQLDVEQVSTLANDLAMDLTVRRYIDDHIAFQPRLATESAAIK